MNKGTIRFNEGGSRGLVTRTIQGPRVETDEDGGYTWLASFPDTASGRRGEAVESWRVRTVQVLDIHLETVERLEKP